MYRFIGILVGLWFAGFGFAFLSVVVWGGFRFLLQYKSLAIAKARVGDLIYVTGKVGSRTNLFSPITKTPCAWWRVLVTEAKGKSSVMLLDRESLQAFPVIDNTGTIQVLPLSSDSPEPVKIGSGSRFLTVLRFSNLNFLTHGNPHYLVYQNLLEKLTEPQIAFLEDCNLNLNGLPGKPSLVLREYIWQIGNPIYAFGKVIRHDRYGKALALSLISRRPPSCIAIALIFLGMIFGVFFAVLGLKLAYKATRALF